MEGAGVAAVLFVGLNVESHKHKITNRERRRICHVVDPARVRGEEFVEPGFFDWELAGRQLRGQFRGRVISNDVKPFRRRRQAVNDPEMGKSSEADHGGVCSPNWLSTR